MWQFCCIQCRKGTVIGEHIPSSDRGTKCMECIELRGSRGRRYIAIRCSMHWWRPHPCRLLACMFLALRLQPPCMGNPRVVSACGIPNCSVVDVGRGRQCVDPFYVCACHDSVEASIGTLLSWEGPCLELPRAGRLRFLGPSCLIVRCMHWVERTHTWDLWVKLLRTHRPWRMGWILWLDWASSSSSTGLRAAHRSIFYRTSSTDCRFWALELARSYH